MAAVYCAPLEEAVEAELRQKSEPGSAMTENLLRALFEFITLELSREMVDSERIPADNRSVVRICF